MKFTIYILWDRIAPPPVQEIRPTTSHLPLSRVCAHPPGCLATSRGIRIGHNVITRGFSMKILVPVDPSDTANLAVTRAAEMAKKERAQLTLLAVAETFQDMENLFGNEAADVMRDRAASALEAAKVLAAGTKPKAVLKFGDSPEDIIVDVAEKGGFDLIVMGTRSKKGKTGLRLGSVSSRVVAQAHCSVLVVR
ncbi:MAG: hypothetical protein CVU73_13180 [Deltaproteobacteria bacterium HGW-Deltaproteobacteria-8]|nr:MAG: hypothetical protein CVU73_13180 [Deltaproteobacteria bacterium HGW-Deltaproteobacteria-8]